MNRSVSQKMSLKMRLLPIVIVGVVILLAVRVGELSLGLEFSPAGPALAAEDEAAAEHAEEESTAATPAGDIAEKEAEEGERTTDFPVEFTPAEVAVLQALSIRRDELEKFEKDLGERERLLNATEGRLDKRIEELQVLHDSIETLVRQYNEQEAAELLSVVKIYETMKPKNAAKILGEIEMRVLLGIMESMKERKSAPILSAMEPERAREVTTELARKRAVDLTAQGGKDDPSG